MWAWRVACALVVCACAAAAPLDAASAPPPTAPDLASPVVADCDTLLLNNTPALPQNVREHEAAVVQLARTLAELVSSGAADETRAASLARAAARTPLAPPPAAVALGAPHLHLGVLYLVEADKLYVFHQNNSLALKHFWITLASAWNVSSAVWSSAWGGCGVGGMGTGAGGWWSGVAAARGVHATRAAAALFRRHAALPCERVMHAWLGGAPSCDDSTTLCEAMAASSPSSTHKLTYRCRCRDDHWTTGIADATSALATNEWVFGETLAVSGPLACQPCALAAGLQCMSDTVRAILLAANLSGVTLCVIAATTIFKRRKCKLIASSMWTVLEVMVFGVFLMYASAGSSFLTSPLWRCLSGPWLRELGFIACYGSVVLRLWVLLAEFRTRKAHRWTPRDAEVLKILGAMLLGAVCYLAAFTATSICSNTEEDASSCAHTQWYDVTAAAEILLLLVGLRIGYATRNANVPFQEQWWLCGALAAEGAGGVAWRVAARTGGAGGAGGAAPERSALWAAARAALSGAAALACVLAPRLYYALCHHEVSRCSQSEGFMSVHGGGGGEEEPSVEEARAELRRLYAALEALRGRALRRDNPHVSRRRGGRKPPHRRFSLQALQARRGNKNKGGNSTVEASDVGESRTPEDSVCSIEGPSHYTDGD